MQRGDDNDYDDAERLPAAATPPPTTGSARRVAKDRESAPCQTTAEWGSKRNKMGSMG